MRELHVPADIGELEHVIGFMEEQLDEMGCSAKTRMQLDIAVEEIFVNIAHYAYPEAEGNAVIRIWPDERKEKVMIEFSDHGIPFDPLKKSDPNIHLALEQRSIGGLGIYMVKKSMDNVSYRYENGQNILTIEKRTQT